MKFVYFLLPFLFLCVFCKKKDDLGPSPIDFKSKYVGTYTCTEVHINLQSSPMGYIVFDYDTVSTSAPIQIQSNANKSMSLFIGSSEYQASTDMDTVFYCINCPGSPNYIKFLSPDQVYICKANGVTNSIIYTGIK